MKALKRWWRPLAGLLAVLLLLLAARKLPVVEWLEVVAAPLRDQGWLGVGLYALVYFAAGMLCLPCAPLTLAGGYIFGTLKGTLAVHTGCMLAAALGFAIGRCMGRRRAADWLRSRKRFRYLDDAVANDGWKIVGLLRMQALPFGISNYLYGLTKIKFRHYFLATAVAMLPGHLIYCHLGAVGGRHLSGQHDIGPLELLAPALGIVSLITVTIVLTRIARREGAKREKSGDGEEAEPT